MLNRNKISKDNVLNALSDVIDPEPNQDIISLGAVRDLEIDGGDVSFRIVLVNPTYERRRKVEEAARAALASLDNVGELDVRMGAEIPSDGRVRDLLEAPVKNVIAVASGKGGVGKSTVAVNLSIVLSQTGARVGLLDADIYGPNVPTMMGLDRLPPPQNNKMSPAEAYDVKVMSIGFLVDRDQPLIWRGPMLHSAIRQFASDVNWGELDYLIVDLPPGTGDAPLSVAQSLPLTGGVIVTLPQQVSLDDARRGLEMFRKLDVDVFGVIENMSFLELPDGTKMDVFGSGGGEQLAKERGVAFLGNIPMDPAVRAGGDAGKPVMITKPDAPVAQAMRQIGEDLAGRVWAASAEQDNLISIDMIG